MSEYWVSKKKYFCKYCEIYIADDVPSRQHHENGLRHKGNRERFIRGLYKDGEKRKKDSEEEKREMARIELAAQAAFSQDVGAGRAKASSASAEASSSKSRKPHTKPSNPFTNYSTAASLGFTDPDAERLAAEVAQRQSQGVAGDWQVVETTPSEGDVAVPLDGEQSLKRPAEDNQDDTRSFKLRKKTLATGLGEIYDPGVITLKPKKKEVKEEEEIKSSIDVPDVSRAGEKPKWIPLQWKPPSQVNNVRTVPSIATPSETLETPENPLSVKSEDGNESLGNKGEVPSVDEVPFELETEEAKSSLSVSAEVEPGPSLFRKRKVAAGSGSRGKR